MLPGATVTLTIATDALRLAITAATELNDSRLLLTGGDEDELAVVAGVPNVGNLPTGESAAIVRVEGRARITSTQVEAGAATFAEPIINLVLAEDGNVETNQSTTCLDGSQKGLTYWYDGVEWIQAQQKTSIQQPPLFDIYNASGVSLSNQTVYPSSACVTFVHTCLC